MAAKVDLHIHSKFSDRSAEWIFRRLEFPDSYSDPRVLYRRLKEKGMSYVTFTDHNRIDGCLEIAEFPDTFISEEVTAQFPDDSVNVHLLLWNLTEAQHAEIQQVKRNVYELQEYLAQWFRKNESKFIRAGFVNGLPGFITLEADGELQTTAVEIQDEKITAIYVVRNPDKLRHLQ